MLFMSTAEKFDPVSVADYLKGEQTAKRKHEYIGGNMYAMAGASNVHNRIATNVTVAFGSQFRDSPCEIFNSDTKVRVRAISVSSVGSCLKAIPFNEGGIH